MSYTVTIKEKNTGNFKEVLHLPKNDTIQAFFTQRGFQPKQTKKIERITLFVLKRELAQQLKKSPDSHTQSIYQQLNQAIQHHIQKDDDLYCS